MTTIGTDDPLATAAVDAIHSGDVAALRRLLAEQPWLSRARLGDDDPCGMSRTLLHVATDWPGHFPNGPQIVEALVELGADVNGRFRGPHEETPLHWAASSDDVTVLAALLDAGADPDAGTPSARQIAAMFDRTLGSAQLVQRACMPCGSRPQACRSVKCDSRVSANAPAAFVNGASRLAASAIVRLAPGGANGVARRPGRPAAIIAGSNAIPSPASTSDATASVAPPSTPVRGENPARSQVVIVKSRRS
jgi:hypothetical protein